MSQDEKEKFVRDELEKIYPQLLINCKKTVGAGFKRWGDDLLPLCIEMFLEMQTDKQVKIIQDGKLENYITKSMGMQLKSKTTRFWHKYRKLNESLRDFLPNYNYGPDYTTFNKSFEESNLPVRVIKCLQQAIKDFMPYEKMLVNEILIQKQTYASISKKYNISYGHLKKDSKDIQKQLKELCRNYF